MLSLPFESREKLRFEEISWQSKKKKKKKKTKSMYILRFLELLSQHQDSWYVQFHKKAVLRIA